MTTRLIYRSYGGENMKSRPAFYSKLLALASFVRAAEAADAEVIFLNDGPIPTDRLNLMADHGDLIAIPQGPVGMRASYLRALRMPLDMQWPDSDVVYYSEDDYLHKPNAFTSLVTAADTIPQARYFTLHGAKERDPALDFPRDWRPGPDVSAAGQTWVNIPSTTSTFGARAGAIKEDLAIFKQCMRPFRHRYLDHETCLLYQGYQPYTGGEVFIGPPETRGTSLDALAKTAVLVPFRAAINLRGRIRRDRPHLLYASDPNLACHLENDFLSAGVDWAGFAEETRAWAAAAGLLIQQSPAQS